MPHCMQQVTYLFRTSCKSTSFGLVSRGCHMSPKHSLSPSKESMQFPAYRLAGLQVPTCCICMWLHANRCLYTCVVCAASDALAAYCLVFTYTLCAYHAIPCCAGVPTGLSENPVSSSNNIALLQWHLACFEYHCEG